VKDRKKLSNLAIINDGTLKIGDIVAWRYIGGTQDGHSSIYIGGGYVVYAGGGADGSPIVNTLDNVNTWAIGANHELYVVRRYSGKP
jgi:hypothetical protein